MNHESKKSPAVSIALTDEDLGLVTGGHPGHALPPGLGPKHDHGGPPWYQPGDVTIVQIGEGNVAIVG